MPVSEGQAEQTRDVLAEGFNDAFKFPEAQVDESRPQKEHKYEEEFPH